MKQLLQYLNEQWSGATRAYKKYHRKANKLSASAHIAHKKGDSNMNDLNHASWEAAEKSLRARSAIPKNPERDKVRRERDRLNPSRNINKLHKRINADIRKQTGK